MHRKLVPIISYLDSLSGRIGADVLPGLLRDLNLTAEEIVSLCAFHPDHYCRTELSSSRWYDLLILGWRPGQSSPIHDHTGSTCGFKILSGKAHEELYTKVPSPSGCEYVRPSGVHVYEAGSSCLTQDREIHRISNRSRTENLVTLHVYSPPLRMAYYELDPELHAGVGGDVQTYV